MSAHPPSNGTMGSMWTAVWCDRCRLDHSFSHVGPDEQEAPGCLFLVQTMTEKGPFDFLRDEQDYEAQGGGWDPRKLVCVMFDRCPCQDDPGWEPPVEVPPDPNQGLLFDVLPDSPVSPGGTVIPLEILVRAGASS